MANTYDLTQTGSEVQAILNDANNIKGAGAQTTLTTDYVLLKDTNDQYHKILKDSFTEACRNVLAGLLVNNDKGTTISQIAAIASGDFGSVTPANLASVLGEIADAAQVLTASDNVDNLKESKNYLVASNTVASLQGTKPPTTGYALIEVVEYTKNSNTMQRWTNLNNQSNRIYERWFNSGSWGEWFLIK